MNKKRKLIEVAILVILGIVMGLTMVVTGGDGAKSENYMDLRGNWTITINGQSHQTDDIEKDNFPVLNKGDRLTMETVIPEHEIAVPELRFFFIHSVVDVYLDEECIYSFGHDLYEQGKMVGYGYHQVLLPDDNIGKTLRVELLVTENDAFTMIDMPQIYNSQVAVRDYVYENRMPLILSCFLMIFGIGVAVLSAVGIFAQREFFQPLCVGLFSFGIGLWSFSNYNLTFLFTDNPLMKVYLEYGALYVAPLFVLLYFWDEEKQRGNKYQRICFWILGILQGGFILIAMGGQILGWLHFPEVLRIQHILLVAMVGYLLSVFVSDLVHKRYDNIILMLGAAIMIVFALFDLLRFYLEKYNPAMTRGEYRGYICIGTMLFVIAMMINYVNEISDVLYHSVEEATLQRMAYTDTLTGLSNRRACEERMDELDEKKSDYAVIEFDLNCLKKVNDTFGHEEGDRFLTAFSAVLRDVFAEDGLVSRIGGDEFVVLIEDAKKADLQERFRELQEQLTRANSQSQKWKLSTAYGVCTYAEDKVYPSRKALKVADERMYLHKAEMKTRGV